MTLEGRIPPHHMDAEHAVLGCALLEADKMLDEPWALLPGDAFYSERHRYIWQAIQEIRLAQGRVDEITVAELLERQGRLNQIGGFSFLSNARDAAPPLYNVQAHAEIVREKWQQRRLIQICGEAMRAAYGDDKTAQEIAYETDNALLAVVESRNADPVSIADAANQALAKYQAVQAGTRAKPITLGFSSDVDAVLMLEAGDLMLLMAGTGVGKSLLALQIAESVARRGRPALYYTLEMPAEQKGERVLVQKTGANLAALRNGQMTPGDVSQFQNIIANLRGVPLWIQDQLESEAQIIADIRRQVKLRQVGFVVLDYLGLIEGQEGEKRYLMLNQITKRMKRLAVSLGIVILILNQLDFESEGARPSLKNSADSKGISRDADVVGLFWREPGSNTRLSDVGEFIVAKGRNVPTGIHRIKYDKQFMRFDRA